MPGKTMISQSCNRWVKDTQLNRDFVLHVEKTTDMITQNTLFGNQQPFNSKWQIIKFVELQYCSCYFWYYILDCSCSMDTLHHPKLQTKRNVYSIFDLRHIAIPDRLCRLVLIATIHTRHDDKHTHNLDLNGFGF